MNLLYRDRYTFVTAYMQGTIYSELHVALLVLLYSAQVLHEADMQKTLMSKILMN